MTLTCYRCPRKIAWRGSWKLRERIALAFGWMLAGERFFCPNCQHGELSRRLSGT